MTRRPFPTRVVFVLLLAALLATPAAMAAQPRPRTENRPARLVAVLVSELRDHVWSLLGGFWGKNGCVADPHGGCASSTTDTTVQVDEGCSIDPHGGCGQ
jgi:hypothetical protein